MENVNGLMPVYEVNKGEGYHDGNCWFVWIVLLLVLLGGNGIGMRNGDYATQAQVYASNDSQTMMGKIDNLGDMNFRLGNGISDATYALNNAITTGFTGVMRDNFGLQNTMMGGFNNIGQAINQNRFEAQKCCCETNRAIDGVNFNNVINTSKITENATYNTQKILDKLCAMEMNAEKAENAQLRQALFAEQLANSQQLQNATLIGALRPFPQPAYLTASPYQSIGCPCAYNA